LAELGFGEGGEDFPGGVADEICDVVHIRSVRYLFGKCN
jgi:hypothetical protein